ncbi:MAG: class I SAM-dependent methyltransferase [Candidatus Acidiferrales bacterium]
MPRSSKIAPNRHANHPFDRKYGVDTGGYLSPEDLRQDSASDAWNNGYSAVAPSVFREACRRWRETLASSAARVEAYTFVDVGAGKGRALLLASELPFRKVIGIELNEGLARIAQRNVTIWKRSAHPRARIYVRREDALEFRWPRPPLLVYLNNPFECELVERLAGKLAGAAESGPGLVDVLYVNPACVEAFSRSRQSVGHVAPAVQNPREKSSFQLLWNAEIEMDSADQQADPYGAASDRVAAFRFRP